MAESREVCDAIVIISIRLRVDGFLDPDKGQFLPSREIILSRRRGMQAVAPESRDDAFGFYAVASASLLESAVPEYVANLISLFEGDPEVEAWLNKQWIAEELEHGRLARAYVEEIWPEFNWHSAFAEYHKRIPKGTTVHLRSSRALEALARCVTETYAAMMYRCLAAYTRDQRLRSLLLGFSRDEIRHYTKFRRIFESYNQGSPESLWRKASTILSRSDLADDRDVAIAFSCLNEFWRCPPPFTCLCYDDFRRRVRCLMREHLPLDDVLRMLLRPLGAGSPTLQVARWVISRGFRSRLGM